MNLNKLFERILFSEIVGRKQALQRELAVVAHDDEGQIRKGSGKRYWTHTQWVSDFLEKMGEKREYILIAAELHDSFEDTQLPYETAEEMFGNQQVKLIKELTNDKEAINKMGKEEYMNHHLIELSDDALEIKLSDIKNNMEDNPKPEQRARMIVNLKFLKKNRELNKIQRKIFNLIKF